MLVLCIGNSCRSQMAAGWINHLLGSEWEASSAGTMPAERVHPLAVQVMAEVGVDLSSCRPTSVETRRGELWDLVVTVCDAAREACPAFAGPCEQLHVSFEDPAETGGAEAQKLAAFRRVRDAIRDTLIPALRARGRRRSAPMPGTRR